MSSLACSRRHADGESSPEDRRATCTGGTEAMHRASVLVAARRAREGGTREVARRGAAGVRRGRAARAVMSVAVGAEGGAHE